MRTNIEIDQKVIDEILEKTNIKTKREAVDLALKEFLRMIKLKELSELAGKVNWSGDLDSMRTD
ncbi:transcription regulator of the Arc/MetJ class [Belliella baltica DSM 15883]|uniref:Transcription regulator of the Arc/MetJ class n=1 Tax=Belliella baltica (strain DSM 15883 / CIP 108006 / LMG 21964 / BA134) TaxID=866536 RepID=I3ZAF1_BELBD|nr:type II toxin-antitoxin system VapB family antitoxin [Belliella baltica]AFL86219.1 transcription regulator of the Arc/MetJ class [Belliella baltica DSM 15883]